MRLGTLAAFASGLALAGLVASEVNLPELARAIEQAGVAVPAVVAVRIAVVAMAGVGWAPLVSAAEHAGPLVLIELRFIREAVNVMLPVATVGGDIVGGRLLTRWGIAPGVAGASILSDLLIQSFAQLLFTLIGLVLLAVDGRGSTLIVWVLPGLGVASLGLAGFFASQRFGLFNIVESVLAAFARRWPAASFGSELRLHDNLRAIYAKPGRVLRATLVHLAAWLLGSVETFAVLAAVGVAPTISEAIIVESVAQAIRGSAFPVPGAIGVQEGGYILVGALFGISPDVCLALSLVKRVPDFVIGVPGLLAWAGLEAGRIGPAWPAPALVSDQVDEKGST